MLIDSNLLPINWFIHIQTIQGSGIAPQGHCSFYPHRKTINYVDS